MSDYTRNPQAIESTNTDNPYEPLSEPKVGDTELLPGDSPAPGVCRVVMLPPEAIEKDKDLDRKATERAAQVHAGAAELAAESASPFKTDLPTSESMAHPVETANMALNTAGTAVSESLLSAQDSASATLASAKQSAASTLDSASSTLDSAKKSASSTLASAQDSTGQALDRAKQSTASTLASAQDTAASTLASARDTAASTLSSAQQSAASTLASAQQSAASAASTIQDTTSTALASARDTASSTLASAQQSASSAAATIQDTASSTLTAAQSTAASAASTIQDTAASTLTSLQHAGTTTLHKAQDLGSATADVASRSMHATQDTATSLVSSTADSIRRVSASIATTASEVLHSAEETAAKVAVQVLETVEHSIERLREDYVGPAQASAQEQLPKDVKERHEAQAKGKLASVKDEVSQVANTAIASAEDMLRTASEGAAAMIGVDPGVQVQVTPGTLDEDVASVLTAEGSDAGEQAPVEGFQDDALLVIRDGLPADKDSERAARKVIRAMEKETTHELMEEDDTASMTA